MKKFLLQILVSAALLLAFVSPARATYQSTVLADSPVVYLRLGETSGTTATDLGSAGANGTYTGGFTLNQTSLLTGDANPSVLLNGTSGFVDLGTPAAMNLPNGAVSVEFWCKITAFPSSGVQAMFFCSAYDGAVQPIQVRLFNNSGTMELHGGSFKLLGSIDSKVVVNVSTWNVGDIHHVVITWGSNTWTCYIDGVSAGTASNTQGFLNGGTRKNYVGAENTIGADNHFLSATVDEFAFYGTTLSAGQVLAHYQAGINAVPATFTSAASADGTKVNLTFSSSVTGVNAAEYWVESGGYPAPLTTATGSGTTWSLPLAKNFLVTGNTTKTTYTGTGTVTVVGALPTAAVMSSTTNSSTVLQTQSYYVGQNYGTFLHFSSATFGVSGYVSQGTIDAAITGIGSLNIAQWISTAQSAGARYCVFTTKHDSSFCWWPTATAAYNISTTAYGVAHPGADLVATYTTACRAANMKVGLYINFYDPKWLHDHGNYATGGYLAYIEAQISELLSNYGRIDILWIDSWNYASGGDTVGYTTVPYATLLAFVHGIQPNCVVLNNEHTGDLSHSEIAVFEDQVQSIPLSTNALPAEFCETLLSDNTWTWSSGSGDTLKDPLVLLARYQLLTARRCNYLLNFTPNTSGVIPASQVTWAADFGAKLGTQGGAIYPIRPNVRLGVDRGDGEIGTLSTARGSAY